MVGTNSHSATHDLLAGTAHKIVTNAHVPMLLIPKPAKRAKKQAAR